MNDWLDRNPFRARLPWCGGDLQTLRNMVMRGRPDLSPWPVETLLLAMGDGSGDRLVARLHRPKPGPARPLAVLIHGLTGSEDSAYILESAHHLLAEGWPVLRFNLRGAGPSRAHCRWQYHAGRSEDLADALAGLPEDALGQGVVAIGYSLGGAMLAKYLAEQGAAGPVRAAVMVSSPIDLTAAAHRFLAPRNTVYHLAMLAWMKREALAGPATEAERAAVREARTLVEFDDRFSAPRNGFAGVADYYERCKAVRFLGAVRVPALALHARDDPWVPAAAYEAFDWAENRHLTLGLSNGGGHVGFHGQGGPWHDRAIRSFLDRTAA
ncbi:MAG: alpha/beta fold hydrolase [Proteobacteria bacterium]|nr:alpha/beta fold hydrolase [Pseudomonadota bacterium]